MNTDSVLKSKLELIGAKDIKILDGVLLSCYFEGDTLVLPFGIKGIADACFSGNTYLKLVKIPNSVESIGNLVFANCSNLKDVLIYSQLSSFESSIKCQNNAIITYLDDIRA